MKITREFIIKGKSYKGGWRKRQIRLLGLWRIKPGWIDDLIGKEISDKDAEKFLRLTKGKELKLLIPVHIYGEVKHFKFEELPEDLQKALKE